MNLVDLSGASHDVPTVRIIDSMVSTLGRRLLAVCSVSLAPTRGAVISVVGVWDHPIIACLCASPTGAGVFVYTRAVNNRFASHRHADNAPRLVPVEDYARASMRQKCRLAGDAMLSGWTAYAALHPGTEDVLWFPSMFSDELEEIIDNELVWLSGKTQGRGENIRRRSRRRQRSSH